MVQTSFSVKLGSVVHALEIAKEAFEELSDATAIAFTKDTLTLLEKGTMT